MSRFLRFTVLTVVAGWGLTIILAIAVPKPKPKLYEGSLTFKGRIEGTKRAMTIYLESPGYEAITSGTRLLVKWEKDESGH